MTKERTIEIMKAVLDYASIGRREFSAKIGIENPQWIADVLNPNKKVGISKEKAMKICSAYPEIRMSFLMAGEDPMLTNTSEIGQGIQFADKKDKSRLIPFYDAETTGGYEGLVSSSSESAHLMGYIQPGGWFDGRETAAIRHVGNSMKEYPDGCVLAVREVTERRLLVPGRNYVVETSEYRVTKRVQRGSEPGLIALYSTNQEKYEDGRLVYEPFEVAFEDIRRIFSVLGYIVNQSGEYRLIKP